MDEPPLASAAGAAARKTAVAKVSFLIMWCLPIPFGVRHSRSAIITIYLLRKTPRGPRCVGPSVWFARTSGRDGAAPTAATAELHSRRDRCAAADRRGSRPRRRLGGRRRRRSGGGPLRRSAGADARRARRR